MTKELNRCYSGRKQHEIQSWLVGFFKVRLRKFRRSKEVQATDTQDIYSKVSHKFIYIEVDVK